MTDARDDARDATLRRWAADTWHSLAAMTDEGTGLPADRIDGDLDPASRSLNTSPTNIGGYLWSTVAARELGIVGADECRDRIVRAVETLTSVRRHEPSGMFYNWYAITTGEVMRAFPGGDVIHPFLSSVDNGWLAAGLLVAAHAEPAVADTAGALARSMDFGSFHDPAAQAHGLPGGLLCGGFWDEPPGEAEHVVGNHHGRGPDVFYTPHWYGPLMSEPRIASYVGIVHGQVPPEHYAAMHRRTREHRGLRVVATWGGSMFEELMPDLLVPEDVWSPGSFGANHRLAVRAQREFGMDETGYGAWGFSPASIPGGGYSEWGVEPIGLTFGGYPSDLERTRAEAGTWGDGVVTPHAAFLALRYEPEAVVANLRHLEEDLGAYGPGGFLDAVAVRSGRLADCYLSLDQSMVMAALGNALGDDVVRRGFATAEVEAALRPLLAAEEFDISPAA
ncbi:glucoamylase family protein [Oryzihumus sp.]|uniref:glucoamylase family protein n=1 Tax=Oryzihumus sp. TaxID=1968903 RepID=UPI002ED9D8BC